MTEEEQRKHKKKEYQSPQAVVLGKDGEVCDLILRNDKGEKNEKEKKI